MKPVLRLAAAAALVLWVPVQANADQTNMVETLSFRLFGMEQGGTTTNRHIVTTEVDGVSLGKAEILQALGAATTNTFSTGASLVLITPVAGGAESFAVRDGSNSVDVTAFFVHQVLSKPLVRQQLNARTGSWVEEDYTLERFVLGDAEGYPGLTLHFDITGIAVDTESNGSPAFWERSGRGGFSGKGDQNGVDLLIGGQSPSGEPAT